METPFLVVSDNQGNVFEIPGLLMAAASLNSVALPGNRDLIPLPKSSIFHTLPSRLPIGYDPHRNSLVTVSEYRGSPVVAVAAFMPPGYVQTLTSAYTETPGAPLLPLFCYSAVGWKNGKFYAAGCRVDRQRRHEIACESLADIDKQGQALLSRYRGNRLVRHLVKNCVFKYRCPNACNLVLGRWECPVPVSMACNARCIGCISKQDKGSRIPSTQHRLDFVPTAGEIVQYVVPHLESAANPIVSFGQGCEGEPLLSAKLIEESIRKIRSRTGRGVININTNASLPGKVELLCKAGLRSMRVSMNSAQKEYYHAYYRPRKYSFDDVCESIMIAKKHAVWVSINYLVFPGFTDNPSEMEALTKLLRATKLDMIQTRNLNIDPALYIERLNLETLSGKSIGIASWIDEIGKRFPKVKLGYFNPTSRTILTRR